MSEVVSLVPSEIVSNLPTKPPAVSMEERLASTLLKNVNSPHTKKYYLSDTRYFLSWLKENHASVETVDYEGMSGYRDHLNVSCSKGLAARRFTCARRVLQTAVSLKLRRDNPASEVKGFRVEQTESPHVDLSKEQARELLALIDVSKALGKRDYALIALLIRTGMRRAEAAALTLGDLRQEQGHTVAFIRHGKGDKPRRAKVPVDVKRVIDEYLTVTGRKEMDKTAPLFVRFKKGDKPKTTALDGGDIERIVKGYAKRIGVALTPHGLRATFVTLALEGGAKLEQVQYAAGHADPRTTERYQKRKLNLDNNAVDYVRL